MSNLLLTRPPGELGALLATARNNYSSQEPTLRAIEGQAYYNGQHEILKNRIFYVNDNGVLCEDTHASNIKIPHMFHTELVDQKIQYLLSEGIDVVPCDDADTKLKDALGDYFNPQWALTIQELAEGASIKGFEDVFARTTSEDKLVFQITDSLMCVPVSDDFGNVQRVVRFYEDDEYISEQDKTITVKHAEVWTEDEVYFYIVPPKESGNAYKLDDGVEINPRQHVIALADIVDDSPDAEEQARLMGRSYGRLPFYRLYNNKNRTGDLVPIKELIDDYDIINAFLSNNLQDFSEAIYVVNGFKGDDLSKLRQNIKAKKAVGVAQGGTFDVKTFDIPHEARKAKLDIDEANIYRFGMGFNVQDIGTGNMTNVNIMSHYTRLSMKANKLLVRLEAMLQWQAEMVCEDMARRGLGTWTPNDFEFKIEPTVIANESDKITDAKTKEETKQLALQTVLLAEPNLDEDTVLDLIAEIMDIDAEDVRDAIAEGLQALPPQGDLIPPNQSQQGLGEQIDPNTGLPVQPTDPTIPPNGNLPPAQ